MTAPSYVPRLSIEIREDQEQALRQILPHGTRKLIFHALIDGLIALHRRGGFEALGPILTGHIDALGVAKVGTSYTEEISRTQ